MKNFISTLGSYPFLSLWDAVDIRPPTNPKVGFILSLSLRFHHRLFILFSSPFSFLVCVVCLPRHVCFSSLSLSPPLFDYESSSQLFDIFNRLGFDNNKKKYSVFWSLEYEHPPYCCPITTNGFILFRDNTRRNVKQDRWAIGRIACQIDPKSRYSGCK